ncbi:MAG TPA: hypothetical protein VF767_06215 [Bryobacteraceae bacterium]
MSRIAAAEWFLSLFTTRDRASAIAGDLVEQGRALWFNILRTGASLFLRNAMAQPFQLALLVLLPVLLFIVAGSIGSLLLLQVLIVCSFLLLITMPAAFVALVCICLSTGKYRRGALITGAFVAGALASGFAVWQFVPSGWTLPFWTTLRASIDSETYGHPIEHAAEQIMAVLFILAALGGSVTARAAALGMKSPESSQSA